MADHKADAQLALAVMAAEDMYSLQGPAALEPVLDSRIAVSYDLVGYITGTDAIFRDLGRLALGSQRVYYGFLLESKLSKGAFLAVIRGTAGAVEWAEDFEGAPIIDHFPGRVEAGFAGIYGTLMYRVPGGADVPMIAALAAAVGSGELVVTGHSLGSALATYLAYEAALVLPGRAALRVFASPHPGDAVFCQSVGVVVPDHVHYRNAADIVPKVPLGLGYCHLPKTVDLAPFTLDVRIKMNLLCLHHALSYAKLLDVDCVKDSTLPAFDQQFAACVIESGVI